MLRASNLNINGRGELLTGSLRVLAQLEDVICENLIQAAGVIDQEEASLLIGCGVQYLGFPLRLPINTPDLSEPDAAQIISSIAPPSYAVVITYLNKCSQIIDFCQSMGVAVVQLHGDVNTSELKKLKATNPSLCVIKSLVVGKSSINELCDLIERSAPFVDAYITDTFDPSTGASGATGKIHDWSISRRFVEDSPRPVILAGGLNPGNVRSAILKVRPAGVDAHTGLENASGRKDKDLVKNFVTEAQEGFRLVREAAV